jgi:hypothetical protein
MKFLFDMSDFMVLLQMIIVWMCCTIFLLGHAMCSILLTELLLSQVYLLVLTYIILTYVFDTKTPQSGGRRFQWFRYLSLWNLIRNYFPIKLIRTRKLDPKRSYIFGYHPHGIMCIGAWLNFATEATGFSELFPGITPYLMTLKCKYS